MAGFCRACLIKYDEPTELLQYTEKNRRLFIYSTGLQVKRNDDLSFQLCKDCYVNMKVACNFKKKCRSSDKTFKNYLALKEAGEDVDFCTFLKTHDESMTFRFPMLYGNSTPANYRKDDDNESTCTSIRNFMTDIMRDTEIPDTEARIIREVIEEEADVLDDTLDSHWLQDDVSIDSNFRLDFSFSPFATPRSVSNDRCYTPFKLKTELISQEQEQNCTQDEQPPPLNTELPEKELPHIYIPKDLHNQNIEEDSKEGIKIQPDTTGCTIDRNLEMALKDKDNKEFTLDDLLASPRVYHNPPPASLTPTINNILFGERLDFENSNSGLEVGQCIETFNNVKGDVNLDEFFQVDDIKMELEKEGEKENFNENEIITTNESETKTTDNSGISTSNVRNIDQRSADVEKIFDVTNFYCKICKKQFKDVKSLKIHATKRHQLKIIDKEKRKSREYAIKVCNHCGAIYKDMANFIRHIKWHMKKDIEKDILKCNKCGIIFTSRYRLQKHLPTHSSTPVEESPQLGNRKFMCAICGATANTKSNLQIHQRRHTKDYTHHCEECGRGFYKQSELTDHIRVHTGERPFICQYCPKRFTRRDAFNRHLKCHLGERWFRCDYCDETFVTRGSMAAHMRSSKNCISRRNKKTEEAKA